MKKLRGTNGVAFYMIQVSPEQLMTFVPYGPYNPASVVQQSFLAESGFMTMVTTGNGWVNGFYVETWRVR